MILPYIARHKRLTIVAGMLLVIATAALLWLRPGALGLYHQVKGGSILAGVIQPLQKTHPGSFACQLGPLTEPSTRSRLKQTVAHLEAARKYNPDLSQAYLLLGRAFCLLGEVDNAVDAYQTYVSLRPNNPLGHLELGFAYEAQGNTIVAVNQWEASQVTIKDFMATGFEAYRAKQFGTAIQWYERASLRGVAVQSCILYLQYLQVPDKSSPTASEALKEAITIDQGWGAAELRFQAWYSWGIWLLEQKQYSEAITALQKAVASYPGSPDLQATLAEIYRLLGEAEWGLGNLPGAARYFQTAIELDARNVWAHIHYGKVLYLQDAKAIQETAKQFTIALEIQPDQIETWENLIDFWLWTGETEQASLLCQQARARWGQDTQLITRCKR